MATSSSWNSASCSPDDLDEPSRDGGNDLVSVPHERVTSRLRNRGTLEKICKKYSIPDSFTPIVAGDLSMWSPPPPDSVCVYVESLDVGMRLPLHPFFVTVLNHFGLAPSQLAPNGWRALAGFVVLSRLAGVEPSLAVFRHFFGMCVSHRFYCIRGKETAGLLFARINSKIRGWKEEFFFLESSAPWPCPVEWGEPSRSSTMEPALTVEEKAVTETLLCARGSSLIDLTTYLSNDNLAAAKIIGAPSPPPTLQDGPVNVAMGDIQAEKTATAAAARAWAGKVSVKSEPDCEVPPSPCAPSLGKKRKLEEDRGVDGGSSALDLSCPPGFPAPWKPPPVTSKDGDWKAARRLLQGTVTPSRERELAASKPADVVASSYISLLQAANEVAFSLGHALELEERLMAREREADALREELGRKTKALERDGAVADALRTELRKAKAKLAETKADAERAERRGYERGVEDMKRAALRRYPKLDPARLVVPIQGPP